jgi:hypothetical protein
MVNFGSKKSLYWFLNFKAEPAVSAETANYNKQYGRGNSPEA